MGAGATIPRNACLLTGLVCMLAGSAWAHAIIVESTPKMNARQPSPDSLSATVPQLSPGNYKLHWQVLANDGHITQGDIPFRVADH